MKKFLLSILTLFIFSGLQAQEKRASPLINTSQEIGNLEIKIQYGQPSMKGRTIFGDLVPYGKVWRTGANEATVIEFNQDVKINGQVVKAGKYALFTIPGEKDWTIIINSVWNQWGAYNYDSEKDVISFKVPAKQTKGSIEKFSIEISEKGIISLSWDTTQGYFEVEKA